MRGMRMLLGLLFLIVLLNVGARCPTSAATVPEGCERVGSSGLLHCPSDHRD